MGLWHLSQTTSVGISWPLTRRICAPPLSAPPRRRIEILEDVEPVALPLLDPVEFVLHGGREGHVENPGEVLHQEVRHQHSQFRWGKPPLLEADVFPLLDRAQDCRVGAGTADPLFLQFLYQRGLGETGRRLGEFLLFPDGGNQVEGLSLRDIRQEASVRHSSSPFPFPFSLPSV